MRDARLDRLADLLIRYSTKVKPGELVSISADPIAMPLVEAVFEAVLRAGAHPEWRATSDSLQELRLSLGSDEQLKYVSPLEMHRVEEIDVHIGLWAETNTRLLSGVDAKRQAAAQAARKPVFLRFMEREAQGKLRWCGTLFPTQASAQDAEMSLRQYEDFVFKAGLLDHPDPVASWERVRESQKRVVDWLQGRKELRFRAPAGEHDDGTDLLVNVDGGTWINCAGESNFPDGEVFSGPQDVNGHVNYTFPAVYNGREVEGVRLTFRDGRCVDATARKNEAYLIEMLEQDEGARNLGEIAIGTNYGITDFTRNTLFDEKIGGTFHAAVGAGYPESGNKNESALHWDMVCDLRPGKGRAGGTIEADGELFHKDGRFTNTEWPGNA